MSAAREENTQVILDALAWLDIQPDEPPVFQSTRQARHAEVAHTRCWTPDAPTAATPAPRSCARCASGRWPRAARPATTGAGATATRRMRRPAFKPVIRLRAPQEGETVVEDLVQGTVRVANSELDDMIILRSDGTPTYLHAVVVDDHDMAHHPRHPWRRPHDQHLPADPGVSRRWAGPCRASPTFR